MSNDGTAAPRETPHPPPELCALYGSGLPELLQAHNTSQGSADLRYVYLLRYPNGQKIALKMACNAFTTRERIEGWANLARHYNSLGIYAPSILKNADGQHCTECNDCLAYAEDHIEGIIAEERFRFSYQFKDSDAGAQALESIGLLAASPAPLVSWSTAWCLYDKFSCDEESDENSECARNFASYIEQHFPDYAPRVHSVMNRYHCLRSEFEPVYRRLPKAVFQGDLGVSNIVLTNDGVFKGVCDFNLSGAEPILNYAFCECLSTWQGKEETDVALLCDISAQQKHDENTARWLRHISKHYAFCDAEKQAFTAYYNTSYAFRWSNYNFLMHHLRTSGEQYLPAMLAWVERQMTRSDVWCMLP